MKQTELYKEVLEYLGRVANESGNFSTDMLSNIRSGNIKLQDSEIYIRQELQANGSSQDLFEKEPQEDSVKKSTVYAHYFYGGSDWYITDVSIAEKLMFGFVIFNGDLQMAEAGYISIDEIVNNGKVELDFYFTKDTLENILYKRNPDYYPNPKAIKKQSQKKIIKKITSVRMVDNFSIEYKLIKRFYNLMRIEKAVSYRRIQLLHSAFQKAAVNRSVKKTSKNADLFTKVNKKIVNLFTVVNPNKSDATIDFTDRIMFNEIESFVTKQKVNYAITLLNSYINLQGLKPEISKVNRLLKRINNALEQGKVKKNNRLYKELFNAKLALESYLGKPNTKLTPKQIGLSIPARHLCTNRIKCNGLRKDGKLHKGYQFLKGGSVVQVKKKSGLGTNILVIEEAQHETVPALSIPVQESLLADKTTIPVTQNKDQEKVVKHKSTKQSKRSKNKRTISSEELMNMHFETLEFDKGWEHFLPNATKRMNLGISGGPKNGKTAGACQFAAYLTKFGKVLYNFADQGIIKNTQDLWKLAGLDTNPNAEASDFNTLEDLDAICALGEFQYVFIDLINSYIDRTKIKPHEFEDRYIKKYPNISFILMFEVTKQGKFKGDQKWMHIVDQIVEVKDYLMETRGRYGNGFHIVWEEQLQKLNAKKYAELVPLKEINTQDVLYL